MPNRFWLSRAAGVTWDDFSCNYARVWTGKLPPQLAGAQIHYHLAARVTGSSQWVFADNQVLTKDRAAEFSIWLDPNGPQLDFWTDFRRACRATRPDCWLFDEVVHSAAVQATFAGRLDGTLDFLLARALRETFAQGNWQLDAFEAFLSSHEAYFPPEFSRPAFLENHDLNRFLFLSGGDPARLKLAALLLFTLSAPPIVYYGTEAGVTQTRPIHQDGRAIMEVAREPMKWGSEQDSGLLSYFRRLTNLRRPYPVLPYGARRTVHLDAEAGTYAYLRTSNSGRTSPGEVLVAFNLSPEPLTISIRLPDFEATVDLLNSQPVRKIAGCLELSLAPYRAAFIAG
jgi:cyclomaltodextrinase